MLATPSIRNRRRPRVELLEDRTVPAPFQHNLFFTPTALPPTGANWEFLMADWNLDGIGDLIAIRKNGAETTRVRILDGASDFETTLLNVRTPLPSTDSTWEFLTTDWNFDNRPDLVAVAKQGTGSGRTEVHILSGASFFQGFLLNVATALPQTGSNTEFVLGDWNADGRVDLVGVAKFGTASGTTEVHILSGATNYQSFLLNTATAQHMTDANWDFTMGDWNRDGRPDLIMVQKSATGSGSTEVHILNGANAFQSFLLHTGTRLQQTGSNWEFEVFDWNRDGRLDLIAVQKNGTASGFTEITIVSGGEPPPRK